METEKVKVWPEISSEFRRDREKDFLLARKDSFPQPNMTESMSKWPQSSAPHEQSVINKHSAHNFSTLIHHSDTVYADSKCFILHHTARQSVNMVRKSMIEVIKKWILFPDKAQRILTMVTKGPKI